MDQAASLRELFESNGIEFTNRSRSLGEVFLITSGKGGVGKKYDSD